MANERRACHRPTVEDWLELRSTALRVPLTAVFAFVVRVIGALFSFGGVPLAGWLTLPRTASGHAVSCQIWQNRIVAAMRWRA